LPRSYTPPLLTPSEQRTESVLNGVKPLVKCHTHLRLFLVVLQHPCPRVSPRCPVAGSWASSSDSTSGRVPSRGAGSGPGRGRVCCSAAGSGVDTAVRQRARAGSTSFKNFHHELAQPALRNLRHGLDRSASGRVVSTRADPSSQPGSTNFKKFHHELARPALRNLHHGVGRPASGEMVSTRAAPSSQPGSTNFMNHSPQPGSTNFKKLRRSPAQPGLGRIFFFHECHRVFSQHLH